MVQRIRSHVTYANVMATIAVFIALGGSGYAALSGKDKKKVKGIADQEIAAQAGGLSVAKAASATNAGHADTAGSADKATAADNAANATNAANADKLDNLDSLDIGLGFVTGRMDNMAVLATGSNYGAPSGVSAAANGATTALADQDMTLSPNRTIVLRSLSVRLTKAVICGGVCGPGEVVFARIDAFAPGSTTVTALISCQIAVGASACSGAGPSPTVPANSSLRAALVTAGDAQFADTATDALFSWQATAN